MIKINKTQFNTFEIVKGNCKPVNRIGNFDKKDLLTLYKKLGKILGNKDYCIACKADLR